MCWLPASHEPVFGAPNIARHGQPCARCAEQGSALLEPGRADLPVGPDAQQRVPTRFMVSADLQLWTRIEAMNLAGAPDSDPARRCAISIEPHRSAALRFMGRGETMA